MVSISNQLILTASWRIVSELCRRFPGRFRIVQTHPGGGLYDCLALFEEGFNTSCETLKPIADFNRNGRFHVHNRLDGQPHEEPLDLWPLMVEANDMKSVLDQVTRMVGLQIPSTLPFSTSNTLVYRFIAGILTTAIFGKDKWNCKNGYFDSSDGGCGVQDGAFQLFPKANKHLKERMVDDFLGEPAYRFWFITRNEKPVLCLETTGNLWTLDGNQHQLMNVYKEKQRKLWLVIGLFAGDLMK